MDSFSLSQPVAHHASEASASVAEKVILYKRKTNLIPGEIT